jgi:hypothetical protein
LTGIGPVPTEQPDPRVELIRRAKAAMPSKEFEDWKATLGDEDNSDGWAQFENYVAAAEAAVAKLES